MWELRRGSPGHYYDYRTGAIGDLDDLAVGALSEKGRRVSLERRSRYLALVLLKRRGPQESSSFSHRTLMSNLSGLIIMAV